MPLHGFRNYTFFNLGWAHTSSVTIIATTFVNVPVRVVLNTSNFDYSKVNSDGSDIRFVSQTTDDPDTQYLSYWVESWNYNGTSSLWVKVPNSGTKTLYMRYGNKQALSISEINNTMESGMRFRYFGATASFTNLVGGGTCSAPNTDWGGGAVSVCGVGSSADNVTVMWDGWVIPIGAVSHIFHGTSDDGQRLYVNSNLIINAWVDRGPTEDNATVNMTDTLPKRIQYDWYENGGGATARLGWTPSGQAKAYPIPSTNLRSPKYDPSYPDPYSYSATIL